MEQLRITVDGKVYEVTVERSDSSSRPTSPPATRPIPTPTTATPTPTPTVTAQAGDIPSPLAGVVQGVEVNVGDILNEGDLILTLEAMKMYTPINAPSSGTVTAVHVRSGDAVEEGQPLVTIS